MIELVHRHDRIRLQNDSIVIRGLATNVEEDLQRYKVETTLIGGSVSFSSKGLGRRIERLQSFKVDVVPEMSTSEITQRVTYRPKTSAATSSLAISSNTEKPLNEISSTASRMIEFSSTSLRRAI